MKSRSLIILGLIAIGIPSVFASENLFYGTTSFEKLPTSLVPDDSQKLEIKFQYTDGPYSLSDLKPIIDVGPEETASYVHIEFEPIEGIYRNSIARIHGTITVDPSIPSDKIFISISYVGTDLNDASFKSSWIDSAIINIRENISGTTLDRTVFLPEDSSSNYTIIGWDDFEYEFQGNAALFKNNLVEIGILEAGTEYYVIQKADFKAASFGKKDTKVNATIGYAIQKGDKMLHPPMHENATDEEHEAFNLQMLNLNTEFSQQSTIANSYDFVVDVENPFFIKFPLVIEESGQYTRQFYKKTHIFEGPGSFGMGGFAVLDKFSKAVDENGKCKNEEFSRIIKHDYSTIACVDPANALKLKERGWAL